MEQCDAHIWSRAAAPRGHTPPVTRDVEPAWKGSERDPRKDEIRSTVTPPALDRQLIAMREQLLEYDQRKQKKTPRHRLCDPTLSWTGAALFGSRLLFRGIVLPTFAAV